MCRVLLAIQTLMKHASGSHHNLATDDTSAVQAHWLRRKHVHYKPHPLPL